MRRGRLAVGLVVALGATLLLVRLAAPRDLSPLSPEAEHYSRAGTVQGVTFWVRVDGAEAAVRTTGRLGNMCNASGPAGYTRILICDGGTDEGRVQAGFVPAGSASASVDKAALTILRLPGTMDLAVNVLAPGVPPPLGPLVVG